MSTQVETSQKPNVVGARDAETESNVHELIRKRWSPRSFSEQPVPDTDLRAVLEAGRWAASSNNEQPWRFIVARKSDGELFDKLLGVLVPFNQSWAGKAPVLILTVAKRTFSNNQAPNLHALHDTGAASAVMSLQATALGLHTHAMAGFDPEKARRDLHIPDDFEPVAVIALGYAGSADTLSDKNREREIAKRQRKPLSELAFSGSWNEPLKF